MLALLAAALFGVSTPLVQQFGVGLGAFSTAALLYAGAAAVGLLSRQRIEREARLQRADVPRLLAMAGFGAVTGPVALAWGLQHTSGTSASLMLTLEALFTAVLAWRLYRETMDGRVWAAMALLLAGGMVLVLDQQQGHRGPHPAVQGLAVQAPGQHGGEQGLQRQHQRGTGATGVLQPPGQRDRAGHCTKPRHRQQARHIGALQPGLALDALARQQADGSGPGVEQ